MAIKVLEIDSLNAVMKDFILVKAPDSILISSRINTKHFVRLPDVCDAEPPRSDVRSEALTAARRWQDYFETAPALALSGGHDSLLMAETFLAAKVKFSAVIFRYRHDYNMHDIQHAIRFCEERGVSYREINLDLDHHYESGRHHELAVKYECTSPQFTAHMACLEQVDKPVLLAGNPLQVFLDRPLRWCLPQFKDFAMRRFFEFRGQKSGVFFWMSTPELLASFARHPINGLLKDPVFTSYVRVDAFSFKLSLYESAGFKVNRNLTKLTGFEVYKRSLEERSGELGYFDNHYRGPYEKMFPAPQEVQELPSWLSLQFTS